MTTYAQAMLVIFVSVNGRDGWHPLSQDEVPDWVKAPDVIGRLIQGEMCMDPKSVSDTNWFKAERADTVR